MTNDVAVCPYVFLHAKRMWETVTESVRLFKTE